MARMPRRRADLATLAEVTCLIWKAPHERPVLWLRWAWAVFGYGYEYYHGHFTLSLCNHAQVGGDRLRLRLRVLPGQARRARREFVTDRARQQEEVKGKLR